MYAVYLDPSKLAFDKQEITHHNFCPEKNRLLLTFAAYIQAHFIHVQDFIMEENTVNLDQTAPRGTV